MPIHPFALQAIIIHILHFLFFFALFVFFLFLEIQNPHSHLYVPTNVRFILTVLLSFYSPCQRNKNIFKLKILTS